MHTSDQSKFQFLSAGALASRRIIEESSYTTTPDQSPADPVPPCGEAIYRSKSLDKEGLEAVGFILEKSKAPDVKQKKSYCENITDRGRITGNDQAKEDESVTGREQQPSHVSA